MPDRIDVRDWPYQPPLSLLPDVLINCDEVPEILDQGQAGAGAAIYRKRPRLLNGKALSSQ